MIGMKRKGLNTVLKMIYILRFYNRIFVANKNAPINYRGVVNDI